MTREEEIIELTKRTCDAYRRQEPLEKTCGGFQECDCKCLQYNRCKVAYDAGWRKQIQAEWLPQSDYVELWGVEIIHHYECSNCGNTEYTNNHNYCSNCGAEMKRGESDYDVSK